MYSDTRYFGSYVSERMDKAGMERKTVAQLMGVSIDKVTDWCAGHRLPDCEQLMTLAGLLNVPYTLLRGKAMRDKDAGGENRAPAKNRLINYIRSMRTETAEALLIVMPQLTEAPEEEVQRKECSQSKTEKDLP